MKNSFKPFRKTTRSLGGILCCLFILFTPTIAYAHAAVVKSVPTAGASLQMQPRQIQVWFDEAVQSSFYQIQVTNNIGARSDMGDGHLAPNNHALLECTLRPNVKTGFYLVNWQAISDDGHRVSGTIPFSIGTPATLTAPAPISIGPVLPATFLVIIRWVEYLGLILLTGIFVFASFILHSNIRKSMEVANRTRQIAWLLWTILGLSLFASFPVQAAIDANVSIFHVWHETLLLTVLHTYFGQIWLWQMGGIIALCAILLLTTKPKPITSRAVSVPMIGLLLGLLVSKSLTTHAASSSHPVYMVIVDSVHLTAASIWLGSLIGMVMLLTVRAKGAALPKAKYWETIHRFSIWGIITVLTLVASGLTAAFMYIPDFYTLHHTLYGRVLVIKVLIFLIMVVFAIYHLVQGQKQKRAEQLTKTIRMELSLGLIVLLVTALLTNLPTAKSTPGPYDNTQNLPDGRSISLHVTPNRTGVNQIDIFLKNQTGQPITHVLNASVALTSLDHYAGTNHVNLTVNKQGKYQLIGLYLPAAGRWYITVHVLINPTDDEYAHFQFLVGSPS